MYRKRLAIVLIISLIFSLLPIAERAQAEQQETNSQTRYQTSDITVPLNNKYKDQKGVLYTLNQADLTAKVASDNQKCDFSGTDGVYEIPAKVTFQGKEYVVREVEKDAFQSVKTLKEVIVPDTVVTIGDSAFNTSTLEILSLGLRVKEMNRTAFSASSCDIYIDEDNPYFKIIDDVLYDMGDMRVTAYLGSAQKDSLVIMDGMKSVGPYAFKNAEIDKIYLPDTVERLEKGAFSGCKMRFIDTSHVKRMESYCLLECSNLQNICLGELSYLETSIGSAIGSNNVKNVYIKKSINLGNNLWGMRKVQSIIMENGTFFNSAYTDNQELKYLILPDTCKSFTYEFIQQTPNLTKLYLPESITEFSNKTSGSIGKDIPYYTTTWCAKSTSAAAAFAQEKRYPYQNLDAHTHDLETVTFYEDEFITVTGKYCKECGYGTDTSYEWKEVAKYPKNQSPTAAPTKAPSAGEIVRLDDDGKDKYGIPYIVDDSTHTATAGAEGWDDYVYQGDDDGVVELPAYVQKGNEVYTVTKVGDFLFENNAKLQSLKIPDTCVKIGENALAGSGIKHLYIGKNVETIANDTLGRMENLEDLVIDEKNGYYLMWNGAMYTADLTHLIVWPAGKGGTCFVPSSVERIEEYAFAASKVSGVYFPERESNGKMKVAANSFIDCRNLKWAWFNSECSYEGKCLFQGCSELETILYDQSSLGLHLGNMLEKNSSVKNLVLFQKLPYPGSETIRISNLQKLLMPDLTFISKSRFYGIDFSALKKLYITENTGKIEEDTFGGVTKDLVISSKNEYAKAYAETKGLTYTDLSEHTHELHELVFFEDDTAKVSCQYCEECAYSEGFTAENKLTGIKESTPVQTPSGKPTPSVSPSATPSRAPSVKPTPSAAASETPSQTPSGKPTPSVSPSETPSQTPPANPTSSAAASEAPSQTPSVKPTPSAAASEMPSQIPSAVTGETPPGTSGPTEKKKNSSKNRMKAPRVVIRKKGSGKNVYLFFYLKKYDGKYVEIYMKKKKKFVRISLTENRIKKYKGKMKLKCLIKNKKLFFKVRTFDKKKKKRKYSAYSKVLTVKV